MTEGYRATLENLIKTFEVMKRHPGLFFQPVTSINARSFIDGMSEALKAAGLDCLQPNHRLLALKRRGIEPGPHGHVRILQERLGADSEVVEEIVAIEIESCQDLLSSLPSSEAPGSSHM